MAQENPSGDLADGLLRDALEADALPSISVAVSSGGTTVYARALGLADIEHGVAASPNTRYATGSIAKSITAVAAMRLHDGGQLDLDAPVQRYCEAFPEKPQPVSVRQLLAHTAGVRHYDYRRFDEDFLNKVHFDSLVAAMDKFADDPLVDEPGAAFHYSSWGYVVVGCALEGAAGAPYAEVIRSRVTEPAGLTHTGLDRVADIVPGRARGYSRTEDGSLRNAPLFDASDRFPAGGLLSTPKDLVRLAAVLMAGDLLTSDSRRQMWTSATLSSGETTGQGLGWNLSPTGDAVFHGGTTVGTTTFLYLRPADHVSVAIAVNLSRWGGDRKALAEQLADLFSR